MAVSDFALPADHLVRFGLYIADSIRYQLSPNQLVRHCLRRKEGVLNDTGALVIHTGAFTGRSPKDRYIINDEITSSTVHWNDFNQPMDEIYFNRIFSAITTWINRLPEVFVLPSQLTGDVLEPSRLEVTMQFHDQRESLFIERL